MKIFRSSLGWRLYAVGMVQVLLVAFAAVLIGYVMARMPEHGDLRAMAARVRLLVRDPDALSKELGELKKQHGFLLSLYDETNHLVATNIEPPLPAPRWGEGGRARSGAPGAPHVDGPPPEVPDFDRPPPGPPPGPPPFDEPPRFGPPLFGGRPHGHGGGRPPPPDMYAKIDFAGGEGVLVARAPRHEQSPIPPLLTLVSGLLVVGVGALLTTRWISRPLAELSRAARALGRGDLGARTDLKRPDELGEVGRAFDDMAARLSELVMAEKELLANVSHELRTPLARIRVALEIAGEGDALAARESLAEIAVDLAELETLIDDVLATTRLAVASRTAAPAAFPIHRAEVTPRVLCEHAAERFRARHAERPFELIVEGEPPMLHADPTLLRRVIDNLLENAHKYSPEPSQKIVLHTSASPEGGAVFEVKDHGMGIAEEDLPRIFDPFFRSERSRSRGTGGVGLGLTLAKRIVEAHAGTLSIESTPSSGTTARAVIPARS